MARIARSVPKIVLAFGDRRKKPRPPPTGVELFRPGGAVQVSNSVPRIKKRVLIWTVAMRRFQDLDLASIDACKKKNALSHLRHAKISCVDRHDLRDVRRRVLLVNFVKPSFEKAQAFIFSREGKTPDVFQ